MTDHGDCGHTDEEHLAIANEMIMDGNLLPLFQVMNPDKLLLNLESLISVIFTLAPDDEAFRQFIDGLHEDAQEAFLEEGEIRTQGLKIREEMQFFDQAGHELNSILDTHGVVPEAAPRKDDDLPGFYL